MMNAQEHTQVCSLPRFARLRTQLGQLVEDRRGAAFTEYVIIVGIVALLGMGIFTSFRGSIKTAVGKQGTSVESLGNGATAN